MLRPTQHEAWRSQQMIMNLAWVQTDVLVYYRTGFEFSPRKFSKKNLCRCSQKLTQVPKNNTETSFQEAPCRISVIGMESTI